MSKAEAARRLRVLAGMITEAISVDQVDEDHAIFWLAELEETADALDDR